MKSFMNGPLCLFGVVSALAFCRIELVCTTPVGFSVLRQWVLYEIQNRNLDKDNLTKYFVGPFTSVQVWVNRCSLWSAFNEYNLW